MSTFTQLLSELCPFLSFCLAACVGEGRHCFDSDAECDPEQPRRLCPPGQKCCVSQGRCDARAGNACEFNKTVCTDVGRDILPAECPEADQVCCERKSVLVHLYY